MQAASLLILLLPLAASAQPETQEAGRGRVLYQTYCGGCHYERIHDGRLRPAVRDLAGLRDMVARWAPQTKRSYTPEEREDIVQYLNELHYRFALPPRRKP
jgi:mono/diheme cytochrome c family protein